MRLVAVEEKPELSIDTIINTVLELSRSSPIPFEGEILLAARGGRATVLARRGLASAWVYVREWGRFTTAAASTTAVMTNMLEASLVSLISLESGRQAHSAWYPAVIGGSVVNSFFESDDFSVMRETLSAVLGSLGTALSERPISAHGTVFKRVGNVLVEAHGSVDRSVLRDALNSELGALAERGILAGTVKRGVLIVLHPLASGGEVKLFPAGAVLYRACVERGRRGYTVEFCTDSYADGANIARVLADTELAERRLLSIGARVRKIYDYNIFTRLHVSITVKHLDIDTLLNAENLIDAVTALTSKNKN